MEVTINGSGFVGFLGVLFGGAKAFEVTRISSIKLKVRVPDGAVTGPITVITPNGTVVSASNFTRVLQ